MRLPNLPRETSWPRGTARCGSWRRAAGALSAGRPFRPDGSLSERKAPMSIDAAAAMPGRATPPWTTWSRSCGPSGPGAWTSSPLRRDSRPRRQPGHRRHRPPAHRRRRDIGGRDLPADQVADEGIADKLGINLAYLRRLRAAAPTCGTRTSTAGCTATTSPGTARRPEVPGPAVPGRRRTTSASPARSCPTATR